MQFGNVLDIGMLGLPFDIHPSGSQLYSGATGNHVVAILDALKQTGCLKEKQDV